jgi:hypothetical protein
MGYAETQAPVNVKGYVQVSSTSMTQMTLHLNAANGATCGTTTVQVYASKPAGASDPTVTVSLSKYSSSPSNVTVSISGLSPANSQATITGSTANFTFTVCSLTGTGMIDLQADITNYVPTISYDRKDANPAANGRTGNITIANERYSF